MNLLGRHDRLQTICNALNGHSREAVAITLFVDRVKILDHRGNAVLGDRSCGNWHERGFPTLTQQAPIEGAREGRFARCVLEPAAHFLFHLTEHRLDLNRDIGRQHAVGAAAVAIGLRRADQAQGRE